MLHLTNVAFVAFTVACALAPSMGSLIAFRFFAGFFGSCILANGGASLADMMPAERRGVFLSLYVMGPIMSVLSSFPSPPCLGCPVWRKDALMGFTA